MKTFKKIILILISCELLLILFVVVKNHINWVIEAERYKLPIETKMETVWNIKFDSEIVSTPILDGNTLFVQTTQSVSAIDLITKSVIWKANITGSYSNAPFLLKNETLFVSDNDFEISAINATSGELLWHNELNAGSNRRTMDIIFQEGKIFIAKYLGRIYAMDGATGEIVWLSYGTDRSDLWLNSKENEIFVIGNKKIFTFDISDGSVLNETFYGVAPNTVFLERKEKYLFGEKGNDGPDAIRIFDDEVNEIELVGYLPITGANCAVAYGDEMIITGDGIVRYDPKNQAVIWDKEIGDNLTCPIIVGNRIYLRKNADDLYIFSLETGTLIGGMDIYTDIHTIHYFSVDPLMIGDLVVIQTQKDVLSAVRIIE